MLSTDQLMGLLRQVVPVIGGVLVVLGWVPESVVTAIKANMEGILAAVSAIIVAASAIWSAIANSKKSILQSAAQMPEVKRIEVTDANLAASVPAPEVVAKK